MLLPNKIFSYDESILSKFPLVLKELSNSPLSVVSLYLKIRHLVSDVSEYIV
ncbi:ABC-three component system middle component 7, partial [Neobacillus fumarioli]|uniref:ABC-three component system middle component 7 n=1 Tax=Neobacillus fumarioli TaxID=105229 RepID=UPI00350E5277